jgi:hypothetical protein
MGNQVLRPRAAAFVTSVFLGRRSHDGFALPGIVAAFVFVLGLVLRFGLGSGSLQPSTIANDGHAFLSLTQAMNWSYCGQFSRISPKYQRTEFFVENASQPDFFDTPVAELPERFAGQLQDYCRTVTRPFINNENGLMYLMAAAFSLHRNFTLRELANTFVVFRIFAAALFGFAVVCCGGGPFWAVLLSAVCIEIASQLDATHPYSVYSFILPFVLIYTSVLLLVFYSRVYRNRPFLFTAWCFLAGSFAAFFVNLRSSYLPLVLSTFAAFLIFTAVELREHRFKYLPKLSLACIAFSVGFLTIQHVLISPIAALKTGYNSTSHTIGHPLVLALAIPENDLSRREGILWDDLVGLSLARKVDPAATYLGPTYDRALLKYYSKLWREHPAELTYLYLFKCWMFGRSMASVVEEKVHQSLPWLPLPPPGLANGGVLTILFSVLLISGFTIIRRYDIDAGLLVSLVCIAALLGFLEATVIVSTFTMTLYSVLLFCVAFFVLFSCQILCTFAPGTLQSYVRKTLSRVSSNA